MLPFAACVSHAPLIKRPVKVETFCANAKQARVTGVASVMTSTNDKILNEPVSAAEVRRVVTNAGGVIGHWNDQLLALPNVSRELGETDGYARVRVAAVPLAAPTAETRRIFMLVRDRGGERWIALQAFDVQDVCVEGRRQP